MTTRWLRCSAGRSWPSLWRLILLQATTGCWSLNRRWTPLGYWRGDCSTQRRQGGCGGDCARVRVRLLWEAGMEPLESFRIVTILR